MTVANNCRPMLRTEFQKWRAAHIFFISKQVRNK